MTSGVYRRTKPVWNKGLTKETDERILKYSNVLTSQRRSETTKQQYKNMTVEQKKKRGVKISNSRKGMKFTKEHCKNNSNAQKGKIPWNKNTKGVMKANNSTYSKGYSVSKYSIKKRIETRKKNGWNKNPERTRLLKSGRNHHNWQGGITPKNAKIRNSLEMKRWRNRIFEKDNYTCQVSGQRGSNLNVHHIESFATNKQQRFNINNGVTLARELHIFFHKVFGKTNNNYQQFLIFKNIMGHMEC